MRIRLNQKYMLITILISMIATLLIEIFVFSTTAFIFRTIFVFIAASIIVEISFHLQREKFSRSGLLTRVFLFILLFSLVLAPSLLLSYKSDYLEIKTLSYEIVEDRYDGDIIQVVITLTIADGVTDKFGVTSYIRVKVVDYEETLQHLTDSIYTIKAEKWEGGTHTINIGLWEVIDATGSFSIQVYIKPSNFVDATMYSVEKSCILGANGPDVDEDPYSEDLTGDIVITQGDIEWDLDRTFNIKLTAKNTYDEDLEDAYFKITTLPDEISYDGPDEIDLDKIVSKQSRSATFKDFEFTEEGTFDIHIKLYGTIEGAEKYDSREIKIDTDAFGLDPNTYTDSPEVFTEMFQELINDPSMQPIFALMIMGFIIIVIGTAMQSRAVNGLGSFIAMGPSGVNVLSVFFGLVEPIPYFVNLAGVGAPFVQGIVMIFVIGILGSIIFTFSGIIGSARE